VVEPTPSAATLATLETRLGHRVLGQDNAIARLCEQVRTHFVLGKDDLFHSMRDEARPAASFLFVGPSGVGKRLLSHTLAQHLFGEDGFYRLDLDSTAPSRLTADDGLAAFLQRRPAGVVLLTHLERAPSAMQDIVGQLLRDGLVSIGGVPIDCRQCIVIASVTRPVGASPDRTSVSSVAVDAPDGRRAVRSLLAEQVAGDIIEAVDRVIMFAPLRRAVVRDIATAQVTRWARKSEARGYPLEVDDDVLEWIAREGFDQIQGAAPMKRAVERLLMAPLSREIVSGRLHAGVAVQARLERGAVIFTQAQGSQAAQD
jgi:ATP-dependent Clp protease ATP-binding subunit ClpB